MLSVVKILGVAVKKLLYWMYVLILLKLGKFVSCVRRKVDNGFSIVEAVHDCAKEIV